MNVSEKLNNELVEEIKNLKQEIAALKESELFTNTILDKMLDAITIFNDSGIILFCNSAALKIFDISSLDDAINKNILEFISPEHQASFKKENINLEKNLKIYPTDYEIKTANGQNPWIESYCTEILFKGELSFLITFRDITVRKKFERALQESHDLFRSVVDNSHDGIILISKNYEIVYVNSECCNILGRHNREIMGNDFREFIINEERNVFERKYIKNQNNENQSFHHNIRLSRKNGEIRKVKLTSSTISNPQGDVLTVAHMLDITDTEIMEEELLKIKKLESVGLLAGGIAHDFNNILNAILGNISLSKLNHTSKEEEYELLDEAERAVLRAQGLTNQLLTFSKGGSPIKKTVKIDTLLKEATHFALTGSNVKCEYSIPENLWRSEVDEGQIHQVINNLIINAKQSMPNGGVIKIIARNIKSDGLYNSLKKGNYIKIDISDYGIGIPEENRLKIFDPYFSTKDQGQGLGLASVYSIVNKHEGYVSVKSKVGVGTTFSIYLPTVFKKEKKQPEKKETITSIKNINGSILFMDDEEIVRTIAEKMLKKIGCNVVSAKDGEDTIKLYIEAMKKKSPFDIVIMDLTVPGGMGGKETIDELKKIDANVKAIVSSGYSNNPIMANYKDYGFIDVIAKPFKIQDLNGILLRAMFKN